MFDRHKCNSQKTWHMIKSLLPNVKEPWPTINKIVVNKTEINDIASIANHFNIFFSVCENLAMKFSEQNDKDYLNFLGKRVSNSIYLEPTSSQKVFKEINSLNINKSPGLDGISACFSRLVSNIIAIPLSILCNLSFSECVFPNCTKNATVIPLFEADSKWTIKLQANITAIMSVQSNEKTNLLYTNRLSQ